MFQLGPGMLGKAHQLGWIAPSLARALELQPLHNTAHHPAQKNCLLDHRGLDIHPSAMANFIDMAWGYEKDQKFLLVNRLVQLRSPVIAT